MLTAPAEAVSAVFVPAYKRAVLLSLILHGKTIELPKANAALIRRVRESCRPYDVRACLAAPPVHTSQDLATAYAGLKITAVDNMIAAHVAAFTGPRRCSWRCAHFAAQMTGCWAWSSSAARACSATPSAA